MQSFPLLAIPLFTLAGSLMNASGISGTAVLASRRRSSATSAAARHIPLVVGEIFLSGHLRVRRWPTPPPTSRVFVPQMERRRLSAARSVPRSLAAIAGTLGPIIPPSILMVVYAWQANISLGKLFVAGIIPGHGDGRLHHDHW